MIDIRLPQITGTTEREQLTQIKSYLYQLSQQLQYALDNVNTTAPVAQSSLPRSTSASSEAQSIDAHATFGAIKSLIIKSADIVNAYYDEINTRLEGLYVAQSYFGDYAEKTSQEIEENSKSTTQRFENIQVIIADHDSNIASIEGSLETIGTDLSYAQSDIVTINSNIESLDSSIAYVESEVGALDESLQSTKEELSGSIDDAKSDLNGTIDTAKDELNENITNATETVNANVDAARAEASAGIDSAKSDLSSEIGATKNELDGKIIDTNDRIDETNGAVEALGTGLDDTNKRIDSTEGALQDTKDELNGAIQKVTDSLSATDKLLESAKAQLQGSIEDLEFDLSGLAQIVIGVTAYIKSGQIDTTDAGVPVYGIEIGQEVESNGEKVFHKFSRFTSEKLSFYDSNGNEVAYISDKKLYIGQAEITISFKVGGLIDLVIANGDVVTKWEGGS